MRYATKIALLGFLLSSSAALAAPWGGMNMTQRQHLALDDVVVIVQPVAMEPVDDDPVLPSDIHHAPAENFQVTHVLKGGQQITVGDVVALTPDRFRQPKRPPHAWLGRYRNHDQPWWSEAQPISADGQRYAEAIVAMEAGDWPKTTAPQHVEAFYRFWTSDDRWVFDDVRLELMRLNQRELSPLRKVVDRDLLLRRARNRQLAAEHRIVALKLLTIVADRRDELWLRKMIDQEQDHWSRIMPEVFEAYLALTRNEGVVWIEETIFADPDSDWHYSAREALRRHVESQLFISRERGLRALRLLIAQPSTFGNDIIDLIQLRDWQALDAVAQAGIDAVEQGHERRYRCALRYLFRCPRPETQPHLQRLQRLVPDAYEEIQAIERPDGQPRRAVNVG